MAHERSNEPKRTILLVDDHDIQLNAWERDFKREFNILRATCRSDALREARAGHPDVALVDLLLGGENGLDVARDLKALDPNLYVVLVSANMTVDLAMDAIRAGADDVVVKPIGCARLMKRIEDGGLSDDEVMTRNSRTHQSRIGVAMSNEHPVETTELFYRRLLELTHQRDHRAPDEALIETALQLLVDACHASLGYVELRDATGNATFVRGYGRERVGLEAVRSRLSNTIVQHVLAGGLTLSTPSALDDARFADLESVRKNEIAAVLCSPIAVPPIGVVLLQGRHEPGQFRTVDQERVEIFACELAPVASRLVGETRTLSVEMREFQRRTILKALERNDWSVGVTAKQLGVARSSLYLWIRDLKLERSDKSRPE
jgi:ActR/RegA family two-component response regulator